MNHGPEANGQWGAVAKYVFIGFALIAGYFLITEHRAHVVAFLPWLLLLACPLLHFFHGHGGHGGDERTNDDSRSATAEQSAASPQHDHH